MQQQQQQIQIPYKILVWGATGYTGKMIVRYLAKKINDGLEKQLFPQQIMIAGRSEKKLKALIAEFQDDFPVIKSFAIGVADSTNQKEVDTLVQQCCVAIGCVGPFSKYGHTLVDACVRLGRDYCDITGEANFIRDQIDKHDDKAKQNGSILIPFAGFDSCPADLSVLNVIIEMKKQFGDDVKCKKASSYVKMGGYASIGTFNTIIDQISTGYKGSRDLYLLNPRNDPEIPPRTKLRKGDKSEMPLFKSDFNNRWCGPFLMAAINEKVVMWSSRLFLQQERKSKSNCGFSESFSYREYTDYNSFLAAFIHVLLLAITMVLLLFPPTRYLIKKFAPYTSFVLSAEESEKAKGLPFRYATIGIVDNASNDRIESVLRGVDGYRATAAFACEAALCLAFDRKSLRIESGISSPAFGLGEVFLERIKESPEFRMEITKRIKN